MQVHKSGGEEEPSNYRPISILLTISKTLEKVIHRHQSSYLDDNQLLTTNQCGFRPNSSRVTAMAKFTDNVLKSMDDGEPSEGQAFLHATICRVIWDISWTRTGFTPCLNG
jgi:hypothetical protein